jgi:hypothetical protein
MPELQFTTMDRFLTGLGPIAVFALAALIALLLASFVYLVQYAATWASSRLQREDPAERQRLNAVVVPFRRAQS